jgi:hypothetical protein
MILTLPNSGPVILHNWTDGRTMLCADIDEAEDLLEWLNSFYRGDPTPPWHITTEQTED